MEAMDPSAQDFDSVHAAAGRDQHLRRLVETASEYAIIGMGSDGTVLSWNEGARRMTGWEAEEIIGSPGDVLFVLEDRVAGVPVHELEVAAGRGQSINERWHCRKDGSRFFGSGMMTAIHDTDGRLIGFSKIMRDHTDRLRYRQHLERANEELQRFAAVAAHDLQAPLRHVHGFLALLARRHGDGMAGEAHDLLDRSLSALSQMQRLISSLLDFARQEREAPVGPIDASASVTDAMGTLSEQIIESAATIRADALPIVLSDRASLVRIFQNLLGNAIKYHRPGVPPDISVTARTADHVTEFSVQDNGIGIALEHRERVFEPFTRLQDKRETEGTGLGLAICHRIITRQGGRLWAEGNAHGGTTFKFTLPASTKALKQVSG